VNDTPFISYGRVTDNTGAAGGEDSGDDSGDEDNRRDEEEEEEDELAAHDSPVSNMYELVHLVGGLTISGRGTCPVTRSIGCSFS
jgi:hypothetical protein